MTAVYENQGLYFEYPKHWTIDESEASADRAAVTVHSGSGAFWTVVREPVGTSPQMAADTALAALREEYDELDAEPVHRSLAAHDLVGYDVNFICLDFTNTALIRAMDTDFGTLIFFCQADDREFDEVATAFAAMTVSVLKNLGSD